MVKREQKAYLRQVSVRYAQANREKKKKILDEVSATLECHRKTAIRGLNREMKPKERPKLLVGQVVASGAGTSTDGPSEPGDGERPPYSEAIGGGVRVGVRETLCSDAALVAAVGRARARAVRAPVPPRKEGRAFAAILENPGTRDLF